MSDPIVDAIVDKLYGDEGEVKAKTLGQVAQQTFIDATNGKAVYGKACDAAWQAAAEAVVAADMANEEAIEATIGSFARVAKEMRLERAVIKAAERCVKGDRWFDSEEGAWHPIDPFDPVLCTDLENAVRAKDEEEES